MVWEDHKVVCCHICFGYMFLNWGYQSVSVSLIVLRESHHWETLYGLQLGKISLGDVTPQERNHQSDTKLI